MLEQSLDQKMDAIAESIFGTQNDPDQIPITKESGDKLDRLSPDWIKYRLDENGSPIAWAMAVPTTKELAHKFLQKELTERQLLDMTTPQDQYSAIYLCAAVTVPEHRRKGLAIQLINEVVESISKTDDYMLFAWAYSGEGTSLLKKLSESGMEIHLRKE